MMVEMNDADKSNSQPQNKHHPMPCPQCRKMMDAEQRYCPHCGADTDAILGPATLVAAAARTALPYLLLTAFFAVAIVSRTGNPLHALLIASLGLAATAWVVRRKYRQDREAFEEIMEEPLFTVTSEGNVAELRLTTANVVLELTPEYRTKFEEGLDELHAGRRGSGVAGFAARQAMKKVAGQISRKIVHPLNRLKDVRYVDSGLQFVYLGRPQIPFEGLTIRVEGWEQELPVVMTFREKDARAFVTAFRKAKAGAEPSG